MKLVTQCITADESTYMAQLSTDTAPHIDEHAHTPKLTCDAKFKEESDVSCTQ